MDTPLFVAALWYLCLALPGVGFWAFPERRWVWMFVLFGISAAGVFAKAVADYSEPVRLGIDGGPRLLAVLVPVAMVAGDHWTVPALAILGFAGWWRQRPRAAT
jgi:hypothetical protein